MDRTHAAANLADVARHANAYQRAEAILKLHDAICSEALASIKPLGLLGNTISATLKGRIGGYNPVVPSLLAFWSAPRPRIERGEPRAQEPTHRAGAVIEKTTRAYEALQEPVGAEKADEDSPAPGEARMHTSAKAASAQAAANVAKDRENRGSVH